MNATLTTTTTEDTFRPWGRYLWSAEAKLEEAFRFVARRHVSDFGRRGFDKLRATPEGMDFIAGVLAKIDTCHLPEDVAFWLLEAGERLWRKERDEEIKRDRNQRILLLWNGEDWLED